MILEHPNISKSNLPKLVEKLIIIDPDLKCIVTKYGYPPLWSRQPGFATLVHIILEQQVSLASAAAAFNKLKTASNEVTPSSFLLYNDEELKKFGFSRQKTLYCRILAESILNGKLNLESLQKMSDSEIGTTLTEIKGIGRWTSDIYLLMVLLRPDIWPKGDIALAASYGMLKQIPKRPNQNDLELIAEKWKPWRSLAARLLWHYYLSEKAG
ncbi:MAG: DNA-3-methyladenine glycosylase 2 family protein [Candidatus Marinimicrobia bacterium]|nr:DNA-3-methyladenine glycosylase 2 family protein [Candidatus Neomarinimicrobiota bacterium]MBT3632780.1 DNA-3-methyladenine glycosylase 2 family protein [Candidatus Neomarinimicrobiota bacterium]MBT3681890.1 DNA-3-methyladenine glycosylase 2 family protein [Candidatus Neomarinimicrobiota bacterium]MBT3759081.1 DNA-3-methyladenine glycosylase 2 family protein [Candidatus Neomarinimicrobiota bacterium]MBT3895020.1 DNA-3-methyladenine glycosylase 2 family protein [Candidatus Neomarinimicrobiota